MWLRIAFLKCYFGGLYQNDKRLTEVRSIRQNTTFLLLSIIGLWQWPLWTVGRRLRATYSITFGTRK